MRTERQQANDDWLRDALRKAHANREVKGSDGSNALAEGVASIAVAVVETVTTSLTTALLNRRK